MSICPNNSCSEPKMNTSSGRSLVVLVSAAYICSFQARIDAKRRYIDGSGRNNNDVNTAVFSKIWSKSEVMPIQFALPTATTGHLVFRVIRFT